MSKVNFAQAFDQLSAAGLREELRTLGTVMVRLVRVAGGGEGRWDVHPTTTETVLVWSGDFTVDFRDGPVSLGAGECCVVGQGVEHRGTSRNGAEVILLQQSL